jgi:transposase InsO family protein
MMHLQGKGNIERFCRLADVSRASFYRHWQAAEPDQEEVELRHQIQLIFIEHRGHYGCLRITRVLHVQGLLVNHKRVERLMREDNLLAITKRKFVLATTDSDHHLPVYLNLAARMEVTAINQLWVADMTYIRLRTEFVFLAVVIDKFSRKVVGWAISQTIDCQLTLAALQFAIDTRNPLPGVVHHSDRGLQYAARIYMALLQAHGIIPSMSRPGNPYDNATCESFMKTLKKEEVYCSEYRDLADLTTHIETFIDKYYNQQRLHSALRYTSPADFEAAATANPQQDVVSGAPKMSFFKA